MSETILRLSEVRKKIPLSRTEIYRSEAAGRFPKRVKLGEKASGWLLSELDAWIAEKAAARERAAK